MSGHRSLKERLRESLRRTREPITLNLSGASDEPPDWESLEESLILADVGVASARKIVEGVRSREENYRRGLREELLEILRKPVPTPAVESGGPRVTMVVGVNGVGKTTTIAKFGHRGKSAGKRVLIVAADTFRAAAQEQLASWAERAGVDIVRGAHGRDPASVVHEGLQAALARGVDEVFIDTAGRLHTKRPLMDELSKIERVAGRVVASAPHETLLVMDATVGTNGLAQARQFAEALKVTGIVLAKMDGTAKGGVVVAIARELGLPVRFCGVGESMEDLIEFVSEDFVDALIAFD